MIEQPKSVGIWIRVSTEDQARGESPEHHEHRARYYADSKGWNIKEVYHLEAVSGKSVMHHPECQRMLADIKRGHITGLIFSKVARLARNTKELLEFAEIFQNYHADLISLQESIDTSSPAGRLFYTMIAAMAQWEREEISSRVAASVPIRAKLGKSTGGQATFGYQWVNGKLIPHPEEAPIRKLVYELFSEHRRKKVTARILNEMGYRTRSGRKFSDTTVDRLLRDPTAKGVRRANYSKSLGENKHWVYKPESEWVLQSVEPIVSEALWNQCNQILDEQSAKNKRPSRKRVQLFTGFAICGCGNKMYIPSKSPSYVCNTCKNRIHAKTLEEIFQAQFEGFIHSPEYIEGYLSHADSIIKEKENQLAYLQQELSSLEKKKNKVMQAYLEETLPLDALGEHYKPLDEQYQQLNNQVPKLQADVDFLKNQYASVDEVIHEAQEMQIQWADLTEEEKRRLLEYILDQIVIEEKEVMIQLRITPDRLKKNSHEGNATSLAKVSQQGHATSRVHGGH